MLYWWLQKGKKEREKLEAQLRELEEREKMEKMKVPTKGKKVVIEYECSKCGAAVTEKDVRCPKCGEIFEEEIEEKIEEKEKIERKKVKEDKKPKW
jgi:DNA-directed RNA polymerase subunit RPC12/RpoP